MRFFIVVVVVVDANISKILFCIVNCVEITQIINNHKTQIPNQISLQQCNFSCWLHTNNDSVAQCIHTFKQQALLSCLHLQKNASKLLFYSIICFLEDKQKLQRFFFLFLIVQIFVHRKRHTLKFMQVIFYPNFIRTKTTHNTLLYHFANERKNRWIQLKLNKKKHFN